MVYDPWWLEKKWKEKSERLTTVTYLLGTKIYRSEEQMVFCFQNCFDLLWEKHCFSDLIKLLKLKAEGREFANFLRSLEQFAQTVKGHNNVW